MPAEKPDAQPPRSTAIPLWMRKGTLWLILVLTTALFALIAYYLLPMWWARLVNVWVGASNSWVTGLILGFIPVAIGIGAFRWAVHTSAPREEPEQGRGVLHYLRPVLSAVAGVCLVTVLITVLIALGVSEPLREARDLWQESAPGLLAATLVGGLLAVIAILGVYALLTRRRQGTAERALDGRPQEPEEPQIKEEDG